MKYIDITKQILDLHEEDIFKQMINDVEKELDEGVSESLQSEIDLCIRRINNEQIAISENVVSFKPKGNNTKSLPFAETELLAASGKSLADWFSQPMSFGGAGFILDVRRVLGSDNEVDLYLSPNQPESTKMKESLLSYLGKSLSIDVMNNGESLLNATLYVDESGTTAEGSGYLIIENNKSGIKGKISINILVENK